MQKIRTLRKEGGYNLKTHCTGKKPSDGNEATFYNLTQKKQAAVAQDGTQTIKEVRIIGYCGDKCVE